MMVMRCAMIIFLLNAAALACASQDGRELGLILRVTGCSIPEDIDGEEYERLSALLSRPLKINMAGTNEMVSSGLFSRYQLASLADYRARHGDILSYAELAAVDGFGAEFTSVIAPFVSLDSRYGLERSGQTPFRADAALRSGARAGPAGAPVEGGWPESFEWNYGMKLRLSSGRNFSCNAGFANDYSSADALPSAFTGSVSADFRKICSKVVIGDFNARFGQGLALWNGMTMGALNSPSSFMRRPSGISVPWSFTGSMALTGAAAEFTAGRFCISAFTALPGLKKSAYASAEVSLLPGLNVAWLCRNGQVSMTHYTEIPGLFSGFRQGIADMKTSADMAFCFRGTDVFSEVAFDWVSCRPAVMAGTVFRAGEDVRMSAMARYYSPGYSAVRSGADCSTSSCTNECGITFAGEFSSGKWVTMRGQQGFGAAKRRHWGTFSADAALFPSGKLKNLRNNVQVQVRMQSEHLAADWLKCSLRAVFRYRDWGEPFKCDLRTDVSVITGSWTASVRMNLVACTGLGLLGYAEGGYRAPRVSVFLRQGFFCIDNWNDRIYVYERDAPGSFLVPAFYGRGLWTAAVCSWNCAKWLRVYARASCTAYPFMAVEKRKPGNAELRLQCIFRI